MTHPVRSAGDPPRRPDLLRPLPGRRFTSLLWAVLLAGAMLARPTLQGQPDAKASGSSLAELSLEQLMDVRIENVSSASKYEQKVTQAPSSVSIITADDISTFGHRTLADVMRSVRGLYATNDDNYSYLGSRGFLRPGDYNSRTLVLVDGHRMNENIYDQADYGQEGTVDIGLIDRIEVIRGPSSSVYGSSAFFGVINVITRRGHQLDGAELMAYTGSLGTHKGRLSYGKRFHNELELLISVSRYQSDGRGAIYYPEFDPRISSSPRAANNGVAQNADAEDATKLLATVKYREFTVSGFYSERDKTVPTASFLTLFNTDRETNTDRRGYLDIKYEHDVNPQLRLLGRAAYDRYTFIGDYPMFYLDPGETTPTIVNNHDDTVGEWLTLEGQATATLGRHTFVAGVELRDNVQQDQVNYDETVPWEYFTDSHVDSRIASAYLQGEIALRPNLLLNSGVRYDRYFSSFGSTTNPRVALIYNPAPRTTLKALFGQAFRAPNVYERFYYVNPTGRTPRPEKIRTYELAADQYFERDLRASVSVYQYRVRDLISQVPLPDETYYYDNADRYSARGAEFELEAGLGGKARLRTSYALQRAKDDVTGEEMTNSPRHLAKLNLAVPLWPDRLTAGLELQYFGSVRTLADARTDDFVLGNLTLTAKLPHRVKASLSFYNLLDTDYGYAGAEDHAQDVLPQPGRTLRLKLTYDF